MSIDVPSTYCAIDSAGIIAGAPLSPVILRTLARNANLMASRGGHIASANFRVQPGSTVREPGVRSYWLTTKQWTRVFNAKCNRNPNCSEIVVYTDIIASGTSAISFQLVSNGRPLNTKEYHTEAVTGDVQTVTFSADVPLGNTSDTVEVWARTAGVPGLASVPRNTGTVYTSVYLGFYDNSATVSDAFPFSDMHLVRFVDADGDPIYDDVTFRVEKSDTVDELYRISEYYSTLVGPDARLTDQWGTIVNPLEAYDMPHKIPGSTYEIYDAARLFVSSVDVFETDAEAPR